MSNPPKKTPGEANDAIGKVILPTLAVAVVIVLIALLLSSGGLVENLEPVVSNVKDGTDAGMSLVRPSLSASEWKELNGGLKTWDVKEGEGNPMAAADTITCHYIGWLTNGESFDASIKRGMPFTTTLDGVVMGWKVGLVGIKPGGIRRLYIPSEMGYGRTGSGKSIGPNQDLVFEIKCLSISQAGDSSDKGMSKTAPALDGPEWKDLSNGIKYIDVVAGDGAVCKEGAKVTIHYTGWLTNGTKFDSSLDRGQPATFDLGGLIKGWQIAVPGMKTGTIRQMLIPWSLAYGEGGKPPTIPAKADLIFEIKLVSHS
jgi:peptidylprolyl isomerase